MIGAVIFDLDGVLLDSEAAWRDAKRDIVDEWGGVWKDEASRAMLGMSAPEWSVYMRDELQVDRDPGEIDAEVVRRLLEGYRERLPLLPGAREAVERLAARWPLGLASSSNLEVIEVVMESGGFAPYFKTWVSSEEVAGGKPAPDVFLEAARRMGADPATTAAIEDSHNGILAADAAGMAVIALPNHEFPPGDDALEHADLVLDSPRRAHRRGGRAPSGRPPLAPRSFREDQLAAPQRGSDLAGLLDLRVRVADRVVDRLDVHPWNAHGWVVPRSRRSLCRAGA